MKKYIKLEDVKIGRELNKRKVLELSTALFEMVQGIAEDKGRNWNEHARMVLEKDSLRELKLKRS